MNTCDASTTRVWRKIRMPFRFRDARAEGGDHYVHVGVRIPTALNDEQRRLLEQLAKIEGETPPERPVLDKVKDFFVRWKLFRPTSRATAANSTPLHLTRTRNSPCR